MAGSHDAEHREPPRTVAVLREATWPPKRAAMPEVGLEPTPVLPKRILNRPKPPSRPNKGRCSDTLGTGLGYISRGHVGLCRQRTITSKLLLAIDSEVDFSDPASSARRSFAVLSNLERELASRQQSVDESEVLSVHRVRKSCAAVAGSPQCDIIIDHDRARAVVEQTPLDSITATSHLMEVDLEFPSPTGELNFHLLLHLFNFGHGFRHALHEARGVGAWQTMKAGIERWHIEAQKLIDVQMLRAMDVECAARTFDLVNADGYCPPSILPLAEMISRVARSTAEDLERVGEKTLASFVERNRIDPETGIPSATRLAGLLASYFRGFRDKRTWKGGLEVVFLKKVQIALAEVHQIMGPRHADLSFNDVDQFTVVCDNVLPCVLRSLGILQLPENLQDQIDNRRMLLAGSQEAELRACAITAAEVMLQHGSGGFWAK